MQGLWANAAPYYRCRFPAEYALANRVEHPLNVTLRQDAVLPRLDAWLGRKFDPRHLATTIDELAAAVPERGPAPAVDTDNKIADGKRRLAPVPGCPGLRRQRGHHRSVDHRDRD